MRTKTLEEQIRTGAARNRGIWLPGQRTSNNWPTCKLCNKEVDAAEMKNVNNRGCEIVAKCHGSEDSLRVTWTVPAQSNAGNVLDDPNIDWQLRRAMADAEFFNPEHWEK